MTTLHRFPQWHPRPSPGATVCPLAVFLPERGHAGGVPVRRASSPVTAETIAISTDGDAAKAAVATAARLEVAHGDADACEEHDT